MVQTEKLIELVKKNKYLYDLSHEDYRNIRKKDKIWMEIAQELNGNKIVEYATKIGINPEYEPHLLYLAKEGLLQALPKDWKICYNEVLHAHYYYNENTKITQWEHPLDDIYRRLAEHVRQNTKATASNSIVSDEGSQLDSGIKSQGNDETDTNDNMEKIEAYIKKNSEKGAVSLNKPPKLFQYHDLRNKPKNTYFTQLEIPGIIEKEATNQNEFRLCGSGALFLKPNSRKSGNKEPGQDNEKKNLSTVEHCKGILRDTNVVESKRNDDEIHIVAADEKKSVRFNLNSSQTKITDVPKFATLESINCNDYDKSVNKTANYQQLNGTNLTNFKDNINFTSEKRTFVQQISPLLFENVKGETVNNYCVHKKYIEKPDKVVQTFNNNIPQRENETMVSTSETIEDNMNDENEILDEERNRNTTNIVLQVINENENQIIIPDQLEATKNVFEEHTSLFKNQNLDKEIEIIKLNYEDKLKTMKSHYDIQLNEKKLNFEKSNNDAIEKLNLRLALDLDKARNNILSNHKIAINILEKNHSEILDELERDLKSEEVLIRKEHSNKLKELKENLNEELKIEKQKMKEAGEDRLYEKIRCEKRLLEDKYKCLKEKYIRLKTDVRLSLERRNRRREQVVKNPQNVTTTASETDKSISNKLCIPNNSEMNSMSLSTSYPDHYQLDKSSNIIKSYVKDKTEKTTKKLNMSSKYIKELQVQYNDDTTSLSYSDTTISNKGCRSKYLRDSVNTPTVKNEFLLVSQYDNDQTQNNNNNNNYNQKDCLKTKYIKMNSASTMLINEHSKLDPSCTPVENLRQQLQTLDDLEDLFPDNALDSYHLRYPFADSTNYPATNSAELEFFKHRIHLERETLRRAKESLRSQRTNFRIRQRDIKQKYKLLNSNINLDQLTREEKELAQMEVNLHRTKSLLGEKVIRLRHLEKSIRIIYEKQKPLKCFFDEHKEDATLSDLSSHSSSGFSSNELGTDTNAFLNRQKELSATPSDAIQNLEILNVEIYGILDLLKKQNRNEPYKSSDVNWLENSQNLVSSTNSISATNFININSSFGEQSENYQNYRLTPSILTTTPRAINYTSNLVERVRDLKNWLTHAKVDYDMVLANNYKLTFDGTGEDNAADIASNPN